MPFTVREDSSHRTRRHGLLGRRSRIGLVTGVAIAALASGSPAMAQEFRVEVVDVAASTSTISVPLNRGVIVKSTVEITRADPVGSGIVEVRVISPTELLLTGRSYGQANVFLWGNNDQQYVLEVTVDLDVKALNEALRSVDPQASVQAIPRIGNIVLTGTASGVEQVERMVRIAELFAAAGATDATAVTVLNHMDVAGEQQVMLHCVVAEVNRTGIRTLGINGFIAGDDFQDMFLVNQVGGINPSNIGAAGGALANGTIPFLTGEGGIPLDRAVPLSIGFPRVQMQLFIKALADNTLLKILAEPNLVAISGETASFLAGGEFPIPVPQGLDTITIEYRRFGVELSFTPVVKSGQRIRLRVAPSVSGLDFSSAVQIEGFSVPGLTNRLVETTVEIGNGETIAIAGLLNEQVRGLATRIPGIGDLPILGALFRSVEFQRSVTELVILVTPEIIAPMGRNLIPPLPGSDSVDPADWELYLQGILEKTADGSDPASEDGAALITKRNKAILASQPNEKLIHGPWGHAYRTGGK